MYLLTTAVGNVLGGGFSALGSLTSAAGSTVTEVAKPLAQAAGITPEAIQQQVQGYLQPTNPDLATMSPQDAQKEIASNLVRYANGGPEADAAKSRIVAIIAAQRKISPQEATTQFDNAQAQLKATRDRTIQQAKDTADASAAAASRTSLAAFFVFLLGALFAGYGGSMGVQPHFHHFNRFMARPQT
jgi:hypothetical protein